MKRLVTLALIALGLVLPPPMTAAQQSAFKLPPYKKVKLSNGLTLLLMEQREVPIVSLSLIVKAGSVADPSGKEGLASLTAGLLRKGTAARSADQFSSDLDFIGGQFRSGAGADLTTAGAEFMKKDIGKGLDLFSDVLMNASFPQEEIDKMVRLRIDAIKAAKDQARGVIGAYYNSYLYGSHPYGRPPGGDEKSLAAIKREDIVSFYRGYYAPGGAILAVVGDLSSAEMESMVSARLGQWKGKPAAAPTVPAPKAVAGKRLLLVDKPDSTQTFYNIGNLGISRSNPDRVYIEVVNTIFGGRFTSMLNSELRIKSGLSYGASSFFDERKAPGPFIITSFTKNDTTEKAIDLTLEVLRRLHEKGITEEELRSAKAYLQGQFPPNFETTDQLATLLAELEFIGLDEREVNDYYARINSMTLADGQRVIKQYFPLDSLVFVLIGKSSEIQPAVKKYAQQVDTRPISNPGFAN
jgi:predicted Zn-dependent peptidase